MTRGLAYGYNVAGNRTSLGFPDSQTFTYVYGSGGWIDTIREPANNVLVDYAYDDRGQLEQLWRNYNAPEQDYPSVATQRSPCIKRILRTQY